MYEATPPFFQVTANPFNWSQLAKAVKRLPGIFDSMATEEPEAQLLTERRPQTQRLTPSPEAEALNAESILEEVQNVITAVLGAKGKQTKLI